MWGGGGERAVFENNNNSWTQYTQRPCSMLWLFSGKVGVNQIGYTKQKDLKESKLGKKR